MIKEKVLEIEEVYERILYEDSYTKITLKKHQFNTDDPENKFSIYLGVQNKSNGTANIKIETISINDIPTVKKYEQLAKDNIENADIKYYLSTSPISKTTEIAEGDWHSLASGDTQRIDLSNQEGISAIYLTLKDEAGNTSVIYSGNDTEYIIEYDMNTNDVTNFNAEVKSKAFNGMPTIITSQIPKRNNYVFKGWSTNSTETNETYEGGAIIPAEFFTDKSKTITLYAIWEEKNDGQEENPDEDAKLSNVAEIGDYVKLPIAYDDVNGNSYNGWRVISKDVDLDGNDSPGTVNLVTAGIPLTFYHHDVTSTSIMALTDNFLNTDFSETENYTYRKNGFSPNKTLTQVFSNKYIATKNDGITPAVRAMKAEDIYEVTNLTNMSAEHNMELNNSKYDNLFSIGSNYWIASQKDENNLWSVNGNGYVEGKNSNEFGVRVVVSLRAGLVTLGSDSLNEWIL